MWVVPQWVRESVGFSTFSVATYGTQGYLYKLRSLHKPDGYSTHYRKDGGYPPPWIKTKRFPAKIFMNSSSYVSFKLKDGFVKKYYWHPGDLPSVFFSLPTREKPAFCGS
jgi:hypothetical protein